MDKIYLLHQKHLYMLLGFLFYINNKNKIDKYGNVTGATTTDSLTNPISYFYFKSADSATLHGVKGGEENCSAGPVTLEGI